MTLGSTITFNGNVHGGGTVTDTVTVGNTLSFSQFNFTGFQNLDSVTWTNNYPFTQLDNVTVAAVPEPETYVMMLAGLGLMGFMVRRKKTA